MTDKKDSLDGYLPWIIGLGSIVGGLTIGYYVIPQVVKLLTPKPEPQTNPNPQPEPEKQEQQLRMRPKFMHSSAHLGEPSPFESAGHLRVVPENMRLTYGSGGHGRTVQIKREKPRWRVIE